MRHARLPLAEAREVALSGLALRPETGRLIAICGDDVAAPFTMPEMPRGARVGSGPVRTAVGRDG